MATTQPPSHNVAFFPATLDSRSFSRFFSRCASTMRREGVHERLQEDRNRATLQRGLKSPHEYNIFTFQRRNERMDMMNPSLVAGIFRDQADADRIVLELQHARMNADQINATSYNLSILQETHNSAEIQSETTQIVVTVRAKNETQEAANILGATLICHLGSSLTKAFLSELIVRESKHSYELVS